MTLDQLPVLNASLNTLSAILLIAGYIVVRKRMYRAHGWIMGSAFVVSSAFLFFYLLHHYLTGERSTKMFPLLPLPLKITYLAILFPHLILAMVMVPMILMTFWRAYKLDWIRHRKLARPTFWIWLYVSVTGVIIYVMLYHLFPQYKG